MTNSEIRDMFDTNPNLTVAHIARRAGKSTAQIVKILMESK
jgi:putative heme iron utilization protein